MDERWSKVKFRDLAEGIFDGPHATPPPGDDGPIFLRIENITDDGRIDLSNIRHITPDDFARWTRRVTPREGDVVFSYEATLGRAALIPAGFNGCLGRRLALVRPKRSVVDPRFLLYAFIAPEFQRFLRAHSIQGSTVDRISLVEFPDYAIALPELDEQLAIANVLGDLDRKITLDCAIASLLERIAEQVFRATFRSRAGESGEGPDDLPSGWRHVRFSDVVEINPRVTLESGQSLPFIEMASVAPWATRPETVGERAFSGSGAKFERGDTLLARITGCIENGKGALVDFIEKGFGSGEFITMRARPPLTAEAVFLLSRDARVRAHAIAHMTGSSGRQRVPVEAFDHLQIAVPLDEQSWQREAAALRSCFAMSRAMWSERQTLIELRKRLLHGFFSGEIRVRPQTAVAA